jgi:NADH dehydrogenase FAD-containing subunit
MEQYNKQSVILLGDGFFARGFLHNINYKKFSVTQFYRDPFINPQDLMYSLQRNKKYESSFHLWDLLFGLLWFKGPDIKIKTDIKTLEIDSPNNKLKLNNQEMSYDHLVIGLGAQKSLNDWKNEINNLVDKSNLSIGIVGMGPTGIELGTILSKKNKIDMFDMFPKNKVLTYLSTEKKVMVLDHLESKGITTTFGKPYNKEESNHDIVLFCGGTRPNQLVSNLKVNDFLQVYDTYKVFNNNIYMGGDCGNTGHIKTAQVAYNQGAYVAKYLNNDIPKEQPFRYKSNGSALNIGDNKVIIEGHNLLYDGIYPDFIIKMYSMFCI